MYRFLIDEATSDVLSSILFPDAPCIRIERHFPSAIWGWWATAMPLAMDGAARKVHVRSLSFDLELSTTDFLAWLGDFAACGLDLVQSDKPLPSTMERARFKSEGSYLRALGGCGARLVFDLPHPNETAGVALFRDADAERFHGLGLGVADTSPL